MTEVFTGSFTQQEPIPDEGIAAAIEVMRHGRLHRYNTAPGEVAQVTLLEEEFARFVKARFCLAVASGGAAMRLALRALGIGHRDGFGQGHLRRTEALGQSPGQGQGPGDPAQGRNPRANDMPGQPANPTDDAVDMAVDMPAQPDRVLSNAFTLAPVPGAIAAVGAVPVFVETTDDLTIDLQDLAARIISSGARVLLVSHMRGHICDMDALMQICDGAGVRVIEDCAHTMGAEWAGVPSGRHGVIGCYSTQTYKHMNSGEGGLIVTDDADLMARMVLMSGSYMLFDRHRAAPPPEAYAALRWTMPNISDRMDNLRAAVLRPQIATLPDRVARWARLYGVLTTGLRGIDNLMLIERAQAERFVGSSFQFRLPGWSGVRISDFVQRCLARGVELKWFGRSEPLGFTSKYDQWRFVATQDLPRTQSVLAGLIDMRVPLTFSEADCAQIARIIADEVPRLGGAQAPSRAAD